MTWLVRTLVVGVAAAALLVAGAGTALARNLLDDRSAGSVLSKATLVTAQQPSAEEKDHANQTGEQGEVENEQAEKPEAQDKDDVDKDDGDKDDGDKDDGDKGNGEKGNAGRHQGHQGEKEGEHGGEH